MRRLGVIAGLFALSCGGAAPEPLTVPVTVAFEPPPVSATETSHPSSTAHAGHLRFSLPAGWREHSAIVRELRVPRGRLRLWAMEAAGECSERDFVGTGATAQLNLNGTFVVTGSFRSPFGDRALCIGGSSERHVVVLGRAFEEATAEQLRAAWGRYVAALRPEDGESARAAMAHLEAGWEVRGVMRFLPPGVELLEERGLVVHHHGAGLPEPVGGGERREVIAGGYEVVRTAPGAGHEWTVVIGPGRTVSVTLAAQEQAELAAWELFLRTVQVVDPADGSN